MTAILKTRLLHLKKQWPGVLFWLLLPASATILLMLAFDTVQEDSKVPVGLVLEDNSEAAEDLSRVLKEGPLLRIVETTERDALNKLEKHELDSVFIIRSGYGEKIKQGSRNELITSLRSDLSFAYTPVKEILVSYVQQETGRAKAAQIVRRLSAEYDGDEQWSWEDITDKSKQMQKEANLLQTDFAFIGESGKQTDDNGQSRIIWGLWALFAVLSSLLLSDWIIREKHMSAAVRFLFLKFSLQKYLVCHAVLYTGLFFLFDLFAAGLFYFFFPEAVNLSFVLALLSFRVMVSTGVFLLALCFRKTFLYDCTAFILTLLLAITAGLINADAGQIIAFHPLKPFLSGEMTVFWPGVFILLIIIWYFRKERL